MKNERKISLLDFKHEGEDKRRGLEWEGTCKICPIQKLQLTQIREQDVGGGMLDLFCFQVLLDLSLIKSIEYLHPSNLAYVVWPNKEFEFRHVSTALSYKCI